MVWHELVATIPPTIEWIQSLSREKTGLKAIKFLINANKDSKSRKTLEYNAQELTESKLNDTKKGLKVLLNQ